MKQVLMLMMVTALAVGCSSDNVVVGSRYRVKPTGSDATAAIQGEIDQAFRSGGGTVVVGRGEWKVKALRLRSRVTLHLESGAKLIGSRNVEDYFILEKDTVEPVDPAIISHDRWMLSDSCGRDTLTRYPGNRWNNGLIRLYKATDAAIVGEPGSVIFGNNPYDEKGEERYRGPLGISAIDCTNLVLRGYTISDTGNWAHRICDVKGLVVSNVTCLGGHDAIHIKGCDNVLIAKCTLKTGDDCIAGFDNRDVVVRDCTINSSCSAFRFAGRRVLIEKCRIYGPGEWGFRGVLTKEQKIAGAPTPPGSSLGRNNMLCFFTYYSDVTHPIRDYAGEIVVRDCTVENADRFLHYNFEHEKWQWGTPMSDITFERVTAKGIRYPLNAYGQGGDDPSVVCPLDMTFRQCAVSFSTPVTEFVRSGNLRSLTLDGLRVSGVTGPLVRTWQGSASIKAANVDGVEVREERATIPWPTVAL